MEITIIQIPEEFYLQRFFVGKVYLTLDGTPVKIIDDNFDCFPEGSHGRCVRGSDGAWRYCHEGRCTASPKDAPKNLVPVAYSGNIPFRYKVSNFYNRMKFNIQRGYYDLSDWVEDKFWELTDYFGR